MPVVTPTSNQDPRLCTYVCWWQTRSGFGTVSKPASGPNGRSATVFPLLFNVHQCLSNADGSLCPYIKLSKSTEKQLHHLTAAPDKVSA